MDQILKKSADEITRDVVNRQVNDLWDEGTETWNDPFGDWHETITDYLYENDLVNIPDTNSGTVHDAFDRAFDFLVEVLGQRCRDLMFMKIERYWILQKRLKDAVLKDADLALSGEGRFVLKQKREKCLGMQTADYTQQLAERLTDRHEYPVDDPCQPIE